MKIDIIGWVKGWRLDKFFHDLFSNKNNEYLKETCTKAVVLVQHMRETLNSPTVKEITDAIPGEWDEQTVAKVKEIIPAVLNGLSDASECAAKETITEKAICIFAKIRNNPVDLERANRWNELAVKVAYSLADGNIGINDILMVVPAAWKAIFGKNP